MPGSTQPQAVLQSKTECALRSLIKQPVPLEFQCKTANGWMDGVCVCACVRVCVDIDDS